MNEINEFIENSSDILKKLDKKTILKAIKIIRKCRDNKGRIFFAGSGGGAGHASHATNDFRKICNIESYCITDNVSELTARINDEGWDSSYSNWLKVSNLSSDDVIFIFSVGGGSEKRKISINLVETIKYGKRKRAKVISIVGKDNGYASKFSDSCIKIPFINKKYLTPLTEGFQSVIWHLIVSHSLLQKNKTKW